MEDTEIERDEIDKIPNWKLVALIALLLLATISVVWLIDNGKKYAVDSRTAIPTDVCWVGQEEPANASCGESP